MNSAPTSMVNGSLWWSWVTSARNLITLLEVTDHRPTPGQALTLVTLADALIQDIEKDKDVALKSLARLAYKAYETHAPSKAPSPVPF